MNETSDQGGQAQDAASVVAEAAAEVPSAGALLRQAREAAGLHVAALAVSIRVPLKKLEALEADRHDLLPDAVFARALASSVCRALKIDPAPILARLPQTGAPHLRADSTGINVPFQRPGDVEGAPFWAQLPKPALIAVLVLLAAALALLFFPDEQDASPRQVVESAAPMVVTPVAVAVAPPAPEPPPAVAPAVPAPVAVPVPAPVAPPAPAPAAVAPAAVQPAQPADNAATRQVLQFKTRGASWVEVVDAKGTILLRRNLEPGESVGVSAGVLPLSVVIGRADATEVWLRGKPFPLQGVSSENVARFEVKQ